MPKSEFLPAREDDIEVWDTSYENAEGERTTQKTRFDDLISELSDNDETANINVYRQHGNGRESMTFLDSFPVDKYSVDELLIYLRDNYGSGDFRLMVRQNGKLRANKLYSIEAPKKRAPETPQGGGDNSALTGLLQNMLERQERAEQAMIQLASQSQQPQSNKKEFLEEMMIYKQLFAPQGNQQSGGLGQIQESLGFLKELGFEVAGQSDREPGLGDLLEKANPLFQAMLENKQTPSQPTEQEKAANTEQQKAAQMKQAQQLAQNVMVKSGVGMLVNAAQNGNDSGNYAEMIATNFSAEQINGFLLNPDALKTLARINPAVTNHAEWFGDLREHVKGVLGDRSSRYYSDWNDDDLTSETGESIKAETQTGSTVNDQQTDIHDAGDTRRKSGDAGDTRQNGEAG